MPKKVLRDVNALVAPQSRYVDIRPSEDGWSIRAVSADHVAMVDMTIPGASFAGYACDSEYSLDTQDIKRVLAVASDEVVWTESDGEVVAESGPMSVTMPKHPCEGDGRSVRAFDYDAGGIVGAGALAPLFKAMDPAQPSVRVGVRDGCVTFVGRDRGSRRGVSLTLSGDDVAGVFGEAACTLPAPRLKEVVSALPPDAAAELGVGRDLPMEIGVEAGLWSARCLIAPLIDEEELRHARAEDGREADLVRRVQGVRAGVRGGVRLDVPGVPCARRHPQVHQVRARVEAEGPRHAQGVPEVQLVPVRGEAGQERRVQEEAEGQMTTPEDAMIATAGVATNRLMVLAGLMRAEGIDPHMVVEAARCVDVVADGLRARRAAREQSRETAETSEEKEMER